MSPEIHIVYQLCVYLNVCNMSYQMEHVTLSCITYLYIAQAVECVLAVAFGKIYVGLSPTIGTFLYIAQAVERLLAVAFGNKLHNITKITVFHSTCSKNLIDRYSTKPVKK